MALNLDVPTLLKTRTAGKVRQTFFTYGNNYYFDNFWGGLGTFMWSSVSEGNSVFSATDGMIRMTSSTTDNQGVMMKAKYGGRNGAGGFTIEWRARKNIAGDTIASLFMGAGETGLTVTGCFDDSDSIQGFQMVDGDNDTLTPVHVRLTVKTSGTPITTIANNTWHTYKIVQPGDDTLDFYMDGQFLETLSPAQFDASILRAAFCIRTENASAYTSNLDVSWVKITLPSPQ